MAKKPAKPATETSETPESGASVGDGPAASGTVTKAEAIRQAIADGYGSPDKGTDYIRSTFGLDVSKAHFSASKSLLKKRYGGKKVGAAMVKVRRGRKPRVEGLVAPPTKAAANGEADLLAALESIKPLVAIMGADKVHRLVDLLG